MTHCRVISYQHHAFRPLHGVLLLAVSLISGCGSGDGGATVSGVVSFNGVPVTTGVIGFYKSGSKALGGPIGADGAYSLAIPPGEYQVRVDAPSPMPDGWKEGQPLPKLPPRPVPEKYASFETSGITATITDESTQHFDITLP